MKKIEAIVRKEKFEELCQVLEESGIGGITVTEALGFGRHRNGLKKKVKLEIYTDEFQIDTIVDTIRSVSKTGSTGDGKIAVIDLNNIYKIRTGEEGAAAI